MKKKYLVIPLLLLSTSAFAVDGTIQFTGAFTDSPCEININGSSTNGSSSTSVMMDTWNAANYKDNVGATTDLKPIKISLTGCPSKTQANIQFSGTADAINPKLFAIESGANSASNVGVALYSSSNPTDILTPNTRNLSIPLTAQNGEKTIYASYMTTGTDVGQGEANAAVTIDISYE